MREKGTAIIVVFKQLAFAAVFSIRKSLMQDFVSDPSQALSNLGQRFPQTAL